MRCARPASKIWRPITSEYHLGLRVTGIELSSLVPLVKDARYVGVRACSELARYVGERPALLVGSVWVLRPMLWTSDVVKDPWFPLVKDEVCPSVLLPPKSIYATM